MWIAYVHTESGDHYFLGPWFIKPDGEQIAEVLGEEEAEYCKEIFGDEFYKLIELNETQLPMRLQL